MALRSLIVLLALCGRLSTAFIAPGIMLESKLLKHKSVIVTYLHKEQMEADGVVNACSDQPDKTRRLLWAHLLTGSLAAVAATPQASWAGEVGAQITKAVTTSDLGVSVRTSVVRGAQIMDQLDAKWENFSDSFGLGSERSKQGARPKPKEIPDPLPLNILTAKAILDASDRLFCSVSGISPGDLKSRVEKVANLLKISFERAGVRFPDSDSILEFETAPQFNFVVYSHFKAYSELVVDQKIAFGPFRTQFEKRLGQELLSLLQPNKEKELSKSSEKSGRLRLALSSVDEILLVWKDRGLVAMTERTKVDEEQISDWLEDISDLEFNIALDGDITLNSQVLLQEQGFRLYPNFCRYVVTYIMDQVAPNDQKVSAMDYYFDTDYNSDPDKFEVKEVLLSVQLENL